jgi:hypothetical protein
MRHIKPELPVMGPVGDDTKRIGALQSGIDLAAEDSTGDACDIETPKPAAFFARGL